MKNKKADLVAGLLIAALLFLSSCSQSVTGCDPAPELKDIAVESVLIACPGDCYESREYSLYALHELSVDLAEAGIISAVVCDTLIIDPELKTLSTGRECLDLSNAVYIGVEYIDGTSAFWEY